MKNMNKLCNAVVASDSPNYLPYKGENVVSGLIYLADVVRLHTRYVGGLLPTASSGNLAAMHRDARDYQWLAKGSIQIKQIFSKVWIEFIIQTIDARKLSGERGVLTHIWLFIDTSLGFYKIYLILWTQFFLTPWDSIGWLGWGKSKRKILLLKILN